MNLLFWNLNKNKNEQYIVDLLQENDVDIALFAEYNNMDLNVLQKMLNEKYYCYDGNGGCEKITLFAKSNVSITVSQESTRYTIYSVFLSGIQFIIVGIHLQDKYSSKSEDRLDTIRELIPIVEQWEKDLCCVNTIIIGDFNANPFDKELVLKNAFNAVLFKELIIANETVKVAQKIHQRFYNPMLHFISEDNKNYGSYYYGKDIDSIYWECLDQIIVRKSLVEDIIDVKYCKEINGVSLIKSICPDKYISDHLPLLARLERRDLYV